MQLEQLSRLVTDSLEDLKAMDLKVIDVQEMTTVTDQMVIASGTSNRHVKALADNVIEKAAVAGCKPMGVEGDKDSEWVLVDLGDIVVHIMLPEVRDFYNLEKLWDTELLITEARQREN